MCKDDFLLTRLGEALWRSSIPRGQRWHTPRRVPVSYCGLVLGLLLIAGCYRGDKPKFTEEELAQMPFAQREGLPKCSGGFVLAVGDKTITADEVIESPIITPDGAIVPLIEYFRPIAIAQKNDFEQFREQARGELEQILAAKVSDILLYRQAKKDAGERLDEALEKAAEAEVRKFTASFKDDYARVEKALKEMGMDRRSFKERQKKIILSQEYIRQQLPENKPITYSELLDCYNKMKEEFFVRPAALKFRLIDIDVAKLEVAEANGNRQKQARELASELLGRIQAGEDFSKLAEEHSGVSFIGFSNPIQPANLQKPYDILAAEAERIEPGQITRPIETGEHIFIMKLEEKRPRSFKPLKEVQEEVEAKIMLDRHKQAIDEFMAKLMQQAALGEKGEFIDFCLEKVYRMSNR
jgi:parvulin-like peptidyl-prolyl isomerase